LLLLGSSVFCVLGLTNISCHSLKHIVEHKTAEAIKAGYIEPSNKSATHCNVSVHKPSVGNEATLCLAQLLDEVFQFVTFNVTLSVRVKVAPHFNKLINIVLIHGQRESVGLIEERVNDNSDKQVQENLTHNERKTVEVGDSSGSATPVSLHSISQN